jgi:hypothetical protein
MAFYQREATPIPIPISVETGIANALAGLGLNSTRRWESQLGTDVGISPIGNRGGTTVIQIFVQSIDAVRCWR